MPKSSLIDLYYFFAYPYFIYCIHVWGKTFSVHLDKVVKIQKKIIRIVTGSQFQAHTAPLFIEYRLLPLDKIYTYMSAIFMFKYHSSELPLVFQHSYTLNIDVHPYSTRQSLHYHVPLCNTEVRARSMAVQGAKTWNGIDPSIYKTNSVDTFKFRIKKMLLTSLCM